MRRLSLLLLLLGSCAYAQAPKAKPKPYRLPSADLKKPIVWDSMAEGANGQALAFGGQDQTSDDGIGHTRWRTDGKWNDLGTALRVGNTLQASADQLHALAIQLKAINAHCRRGYFSTQYDGELLLELNDTLNTFYASLQQFEKDVLAKKWSAYQSQQLAQMKPLLAISKPRLADLSPEVINELEKQQRQLEQAVEFLRAEPAPRTLAGLVYEPKSKLFVLFGGDHFDYLMNDTWVFDPAMKTWEQRHPKTAPAPRANHQLKANVDGTLTLTGGYTYANNTDYMGGQYIDINDGEWTYDVSKNTWTAATATSGPPNLRVYRQGPFVPSYFLAGDKPDAQAFGRWLEQVPVNTWKKTNPPKLPQMQRDWGTAILDSDHDLILRWSGGHCAHGGTDVLHYHLGTNRWELTHPVEFPLGQLYTNTEYPAGYNFNKRPWITGHTYQSYGYDTTSKRMIFLGQQTHAYYYDPLRADWVDRSVKPKALNYGSCFYTLTLTPTKHGLVCWTQEGKLLVYDSAKNGWNERKLDGEKLLGSVVDNSTLAYDSKRDRLLFFRKAYGDKVGYDGRLQEVDLKTNNVRTITPPNSKAAHAVPYLCQIRYDAGHDMLVVGGTLPPVDGVRRTPVYDCAKDEWGSVLLTGDDPNGKNGRNVSLGLMYDAQRRQFWAVDTYSQVYVLKFDPKMADYKPLAKD